MITTQIGDYTFHHHGDFSGDVQVSGPGVPSDVKIPFAALAGLVAEAVRSKRIAAAEEADVSELLGIPVRW
jgi:hypothetical protein